MATEKARGVDVSKWQGSIDWKQVKASGIDFAMIRLGRGEYDGGPCALDTCFKQNIAGALEAGLDVGVYFYSYALTAAKAKAEAEFVVNELAAYKGKLTYPVAFDLEDSSQANLGKAVLSDMVVAFGDVIEKAGYYAALYSNLNWLNNKYDTAKIKRFDVWLAQWASKPTYSGSFGIWQHSNEGSVPGISGQVDLDVAYYDYPAIIRENGLNGFQKGTPAPAPTPTSAPTPSPVSGELTAAGLVDYVRKVLALNTVYMWGGFGQLVTDSFIAQKAAQYPDNYSSSRVSKLKSLVGKNYYGIDCVGLIKSYYWGGVGSLKYVAAQDKSANGMYSAATVKGDIGTMPETPGLCVWMDGHIGVYIGNGEVIESTSNTAFGDGVCKTKLSARKWLKWLQCPYISYPASAPAPAPAPTPAPTPPASSFNPGDKVKVKKAVTYTGGTFKVYYDAYDVIEASGDRVVIGIGKTVTAAVNTANLELVSGAKPIEAGDKVKVKKAVQYGTDKPFTLYYDTYDVIDVKGDRAVIGIGKTVTAAVNVNNLTKL